MANENWLGKLTQSGRNPKLSELTMPGSHDAGVYGDEVHTSGSALLGKSKSRAQGSSIYGQAVAGSRFFDCRVFLRARWKKRDGDLLPSRKIEPAMGHFMPAMEKWGKFLPTPNLTGETGVFGAYGGTLKTVIDDAIQFVQFHTGEFIILRISHTYSPQHVGNFIQATYATTNEIYRSATAVNIASKTVSDLAGQVVMIFDAEFHTGFNSADGFWPFYKYESNHACLNGITTCGDYAGSTDMTEVANRSLDASRTHLGFHGGGEHLHFVYWQQTGGNIKKNTKAPNKAGVKYTGGAHNNLGEYGADLLEMRDEFATGGVPFKFPNVISHDFVKDNTCKQIIDLNYS